MPDGAVVIFGSTCQSGVALARLLHEAGRRVIAVARQTSNRSKLDELGIEVRIADALNPDDISNALQDIGTDPIIVTMLGGGIIFGHDVDSQGNINVIKAAERAGVARFVLVTSIGCNESYPALPTISKIILTGVVRAKNKAETYLRATNLRWTLIRPGGLMAIKEPTGDGFLAENPSTMGMINRIDLGAQIVKVVNSDAAIGKTYVALDQSRAEAKDGGDMRMPEL
jgi:uncharacterized protein YbjT (DUF2867 family)